MTFTFTCGEHRLPLKGLPRFVHEADTLEQWAIDLSDMYCDMDSPDNACAFTWTIGLETESTPLVKEVLLERQRSLIDDANRHADANPTGCTKACTWCDYTNVNLATVEEALTTYTDWERGS